MFEDMSNTGRVFGDRFQRNHKDIFVGIGGHMKVPRTGSAMNIFMNV
jgi:hypothetical protein